MRLAVNVAVIDARRILLVKREDFEVWCLPGGEVDPGESLGEAAVREVREETGIDAALVGLIGTYSRPNWHGGMHVVLFDARRTGGALRLDPVEMIDAGWFTREDLPRPLLHGQRTRIADALDGRRGVARSTAVRSPFVDRADAYRRRDESPLSRAEFYGRHLDGLADQETLEIDTLEISADPPLSRPPPDSLW